MESLMNFIHAWQSMCWSTCCNISLDAQPNTLRSRSMSSTLHHLYSSSPLLSFVPFCFLAGIAIGHVGFPHILLRSLEQSLHVGFDALKLVIWIFPSAVLSSSSVVFQRLQTVADASPDTRRGFLPSWSRILIVADRLGLGGSTG